MNRKAVIFWFLFASTIAAWAATFDYNPPPLGSSQVEQRNDLNLEYDGINSTKADLASPAFTGVPAAPTAAPGVSTTQIATTAFVTTADNLKSNIASPTFTGVPAAPTAAALTNTTQLATTQFATTADNLKSNLASPTFTGVPAAPTAAVDTSTTQVATTAYVVGQGYAKLAGPTFTGVPAAPTAAALTNTTQIATTAFATTADNLKANLASPALTGNPTAPTASAADNDTSVATTAFVTTADNLKSNLASPTFTGTPAAPTASLGTNTTQIATTAFVIANAGGGFTEYDKGAYAISTIYTQAHGLGSVAAVKNYQIFLENTTAASGWAIGDRVLYLSSSANASATAAAMTVGFNATNLYVATGVSLPAVNNLSTGVSAAIVAANWKVIMRVGN